MQRRVSRMLGKELLPARPVTLYICGVRARRGCLRRRHEAA